MSNSHKQRRLKPQLVVLHHLQAFFISSGRIYRNPVTSLLTMLVIAIALALPATLYISLINLKTAGDDLQVGNTVSLFLKTDINDTQAKQLAQQLEQRSEISSVSYIDPDAGMQELEQRAGFADVLETLPSNPLPGVLAIKTSDRIQTPAAAEQLVNQLQALPQVDLAQLDMLWVQRLHMLIAIGQRVAYSLAGLLALGVLIIIGNTIRLAVENSRSEIEVITLVGGTHAFIRRPYLYMGLIFGLGGSALAWLLISGMLAWLRDPVMQLAGLYHSEYHLITLNSDETLNLLCLGAILGIAGAWYAVKRELKRITP